MHVQCTAQLKVIYVESILIICESHDKNKLILQIEGMETTYITIRMS